MGLIPRQRTRDERLLEAARSVYAAGPESPIATVADHAGVGLSVLYRRYPSKETLLQALALEGLQLYISEVELALTRPGDPSAVFTGFLTAVVTGNLHGLMRLTAHVPPTAELQLALARRAALTDQLVMWLHANEALRSDLTATDLLLTLETLVPTGSMETRMRFLTLLLPALRN